MTLTSLVIKELSIVTKDQKKIPLLRMIFLLNLSPRYPKMGAATMKLQMKTGNKNRSRNISL